MLRASLALGQLHGMLAWVRLLHGVQAPRQLLGAPHTGSVVTQRRQRAPHSSSHSELTLAHRRLRRLLAARARRRRRRGGGDLLEGGEGDEGGVVKATEAVGERGRALPTPAL